MRTKCFSNDNNQGYDLFMRSKKSSTRLLEESPVGKAISFGNNSNRLDHGLVNKFELLVNSNSNSDVKIENKGKETGLFAPLHTSFDKEIKNYEAKFNMMFGHLNVSKDKYLIYICSSECGGWGDRIKGIVTSYLLSVISNRTFGINITFPCQLNQFLIPNLVNWDFTLAENELFSVCDLDYITNHEDIQEKIQNIEFSQYKDSVIYVRINQDWIDQLRKHIVLRTIVPQMQSEFYSDVIRVIYFALFKPSNTLRENIENFIQNNVGNKKLACFHARTGVGENTRYNIDEFESVWSFLAEFDISGEYKIFLTSDNKDIAKLARSRFGSNLVRIDHEVTHIDKDISCDGFLATLSDHGILMRCDVLALTASGFSYQAAHLRQTSQLTVCTRAGVIL
ncbi:hypothetical protein CHS0354_038500 [Potamilus streckersoni]|uniref:Uncharacterized protein n=1 Tax=Potamilus streckersoni TaxID=2493646 RepID=A0AAE0S669_9BIVA|nr:hypothetical protein CHS0354_038500 [Potamilus streckersoni]